MNTHSLWRRDISEQVGQFYTDNPNVVVVIVGGSVARGHSDCYSDIDLGVFWHQAPTMQDRQQVIAGAGADLVRLYDYDRHERVWSDDFMIGRDATKQPYTGILVEVSHYMTDFVEQTIHQVIDEFSTDELAHNLIAGIVYGLPLHGAQALETWQAQLVRYPRELRAAMVKRYGVIDHFWRWQMYLDRGQNLLQMYQSFTQVQEQMLRVLLGLNGVFYNNFKWIEEIDTLLDIKPDGLLERVCRTYKLPPEQGARLTIDLVEETFALVQVHLPEVNVERLREIFQYQRPIWEQSPL